VPFSLAGRVSVRLTKGTDRGCRRIRMRTVRRAIQGSVSVLCSLALTSCAQTVGPLAPQPSEDVVAVASAIMLPGAAQRCKGNLDPGDRCSLAKGTTRRVWSDVAEQLGARGLTPWLSECHEATDKLPELCVLSVFVDEEHMLAFFASPHLLPGSPTRAEGVDVTLIP
jgi:hypothetical protein